MKKPIPYPVEIRYTPDGRDHPGNRFLREAYPLRSEEADAYELERWAVFRDYEPVLALRSKAEPASSVPWEAPIQEVVHPRLTRPTRLEELENKLQSTYALFEILKDRIPGQLKFVILKNVRLGMLRVEDIAHDEIRELARLDRKARVLERQVFRLIHHRDSRV